MATPRVPATRTAPAAGAPCDGRWLRRPDRMGCAGGALAGCQRAPTYGEGGSHTRMPDRGPRCPVVLGELGVMSVVEWVVMSGLRDRRNGDRLRASCSRSRGSALLSGPWLGVCQRFG